MPDRNQNENASEAVYRDAETPSSKDGTQTHKSMPEDQNRPSESLLVKVLQATLESDGSGLSQAEWDRLFQLARTRSLDQPIDMGLVSEMIRLLLEPRFSTLGGDKAFIEKMSFRIAGSLWSHPVSKARVCRFWELISEQVRS